MEGTGITEANWAESGFLGPTFGPEVFTVVVRTLAGTALGCCGAMDGSGRQAGA